MHPFKKMIFMLKRSSIPDVPEGPIEPTTSTYYQADAYNCLEGMCDVIYESLWIYNVSETLVNTKYYYDSVSNKSYKITSAPKTYAQYTSAGSPPAIEIGYSMAYDNCTCLVLAPD